MAQSPGQRRPYRAVFLPKLHGHGRPQPLPGERPSARAAGQGQGEQSANLGTQHVHRGDARRAAVTVH